MTQARVSYGSTTAVTITLASLASSTLTAGQQGTRVDNTSAEAIDVHLFGCVTASSTGATASKQVEIWAAGSLDNVNWSAGVGSTDQAVTLSNTKTALKLLQIIPTAATSSQAYNFGPLSIGQAFGGFPPPYWLPVVFHNMGSALNAQSTGNYIMYVTVNVTST